MNDTIRSILAILEQDKPPELKIAAAQVLGELGPQDVGVVRTLAGAAGSGEDYLARPALLALGSIGSPAAIQVLIGHLEGRHADLAAHVLRELGDPVAAEIEPCFATAQAEAQARMLVILGQCRNSKALAALESALFVPVHARRAAEVLVHSQAGSLDARQRKALLTRLSKAAKQELPPESRGAILCVVAALDGAASRQLLVDHVGPDQPAMVRAAALRGLVGVKLTPTQSIGLLDLLRESDRDHVVAPTIALLQEVTGWSDKAVPQLRKLLDVADPAIRGFAVECMKHVAHADVVKPLMGLLHNAAPDLAAAAGEALGQNPHATEVLMRAFLAEKDAGSARRLLQPLAALSGDLDLKQLDSLVDKGARALFAQNPQGELILELVVRANSKLGSSRVIDKAMRLRKQKKLQQAIALFAFLAHAGELDADGRFQLALTRLMLDGAQPRDEDAPAGDATMGHFALLVREGFPLLERLRKEPAVTPEAMLRIGQHFAEAVGEERRFGVELLHHVAQKFGKRRAGEEARVALRGEGY